MKKWIGIGGALLVVLAVLGTMSFNDKIEQLQKDADTVERNGNEKNGQLQAAEEEKEDGKDAESGSAEEESLSDEKKENSANSKNSREDSQDENKTSSSADSDSSSSSKDTISSSGTGSTSSDSPSSETSTGESSSNSSESSRSASAILNEYEAEFRSMERNYEIELNSLVQQAYDEYMNEGEVDESEYKSKARSLQGEADSAFYGKYEELQSELKENGHDTSQAFQVKNKYEEKKEARRSDLESLAQK
ncbi:hypothetical protein ACE1TI_20575 [Alteribacillus sp. JSM 102045]|uniref:hypothetical protein n=1 Tax=Alteribacillus sp. JSM 102045 TaxID=1562101 RepID=UPI0035BF981D